MTTAPTPATLVELRHLLASAISDAKAYNVPSLCVRLGLEGGTEEDAGRSKYRYAQQRLSAVRADSLVGIAREILSEESRYELAELIAKLDERDGADVTVLTRRRLIALLNAAPLSTEIDHVTLIEGVWPIDRMRSKYDGFGHATARHDIERYTVRNQDLTNAQLLEDLDFLTCSRARLFSFLEAVTGPEAQRPEVQATMAERIDALLIHDGYRLVPAGKISGSPVYAVRPTPKGSPADLHISMALKAFDPHEVEPRWAEAMESRQTSPGRAITLARTLLEDVCKWILTEAGETFKDADDLPGLYKQLAKKLRLAPDVHTEQVFKQILGNCQSVVESLGALRNKLGDAHSLGPRRARPLPRHAALAVNLSGAMATFLVETWEARKGEEDA
jgi:hypothetical protein